MSGVDDTDRVAAARAHRRGNLGRPVDDREVEHKAFRIDGYLLLVQDVRPAQNAHNCRCTDGSELLVGREHLLNRFGYP